MQFKVGHKRGRDSQPGMPPSLPCVVLMKDTWNDYHHETYFDVHYFDVEGVRHFMGATKILQRDQLKTDLPSEFESLDGQFCSLGQTLDYYTDWKAIGEETTQTVMTALRDVVFNPGFGSGLVETDGFKVSLLRFSEAEKAYKQGGVLFGRVSVTDTGLSFLFNCRLDGFSEDHMIDLDFSIVRSLPSRLICFVGKNGVGKSGVLSKLAMSLSGWDQEAGNFTPGRPLFSRVICTSYSIFQPFKVPFVNSTSYRYCGFHDENGRVDVEDIAQRTLYALGSILKQGRTDILLKLLRISDLFGTELVQISTSADVASFDKELKKLSSGQRMVVSVFIDLVANIEPQSLILLDEPESYLHPTLLSTFLRLLNTLLEEYDSFAIAATHSPIVVQEVPRRSVRVFERQGSIPLKGVLPIESLGANLSEITDHVFVMNDDDKNYKGILKDLARDKTMEEIDMIFEGRLGLNARAYLLSLQRRA